MVESEEREHFSPVKGRGVACEIQLFNAFSPCGVSFLQPNKTKTSLIKQKTQRKIENLPWVASQEAPLFTVVGSTVSLSLKH